MNDILARLQPPHSSVAALDSDEIEDLCDAAAQEIERLTAERDALRGLLREVRDCLIADDPGLLDRIDAALKDAP